MDFPTGHDVLFAFDFDGVVCDSVHENAHTTWRAVAARWPDLAGAQPAPALMADFVRCRPAIETGYQNVPLMRALLAGVAPERILADFMAVVDEVKNSEGMDDPEFLQMFGSARDAWVAEDLEAWFGAQGFYPGMPEAVNIVADRAVIITTKQDRFAKELVARAGIRIAPERVYGLDRLGRDGKRGVLAAFRAANPGATIHFFEDRVATLEKLVQVEGLQLHLVDWGYNTEEQRARASASEHMDLLDRAALAALLEAA